MDLHDVASAMVEDYASSLASSLGEVVLSIRRRAHTTILNPLVGTNLISVIVLGALAAVVTALLLFSCFSGGTRLRRHRNYSDESEEIGPQPALVKSALSTGQPRQGRVVSFQPVSEFSVDSTESFPEERSAGGNQRAAGKQPSRAARDTSNAMVHTGSYLTVGYRPSDRQDRLDRAISAGMTSEVSGSDIFNIFGTDPPELDEELPYRAGGPLTRDQVEDIVAHAHGFDTSGDSF